MTKVRFQGRALLVALVLFVAAFAAELALRSWLSNHSLLSADAVSGVSFAVEAAAFFVAGLVASFLARHAPWRELLAAAGLLIPAAVGILYRLKPPSFSYDRMYVNGDEIAAWALLAALGAWLLSLWGSSFGLLVGAGQKTELSIGFEGGVARTHLRLHRDTVLRLAWIGVTIPGALFAAGVLGDKFLNKRPVPLFYLPVAFAAVASLLALLSAWVLARVRLARLQPGQRRKRPATVVMTFISIAGVAVGVWALTVVLSVMSGFEADLKHKILGTNSHGYLLKHNDDFTDWQDVLPKVRAVPGVTGASPFIMNEVMIAHGQGLTGSELKAIDTSLVGGVSELPKQVIAGDLAWVADPQAIPDTTVAPRKGAATDALEGADFNDYLDTTYERRKAHPEEFGSGKMDPKALAQLPGICIGKEMSHTLRVWVGDPVNVITPLGDIGPTGPIPKGKPFRVACILYSGFYEYDMKFAYVSIAEAQKFFHLGNNVTGIELKFTDVDQARAVGRRIVQELKGWPFRFKDWSDLNRNLFSALKLEKLAMGIILTFIVLVACFNILSTLIMLVLEKTKEISILKSMGARDASIMKIFVLEGVSIGAIGTAVGLLMGLASCSFIERWGLRLDPDVYYISNLPVTADVGQFLVVAAISLCLSYLATLYPAIKAARLSPVDGLRED